MYEFTHYLRLLVGPGSAPPRTRHAVVLQWMSCLFVQHGLAKDRFVSPSPLHMKFIDRVRPRYACVHSPTTFGITREIVNESFCNCGTDF